MGAGMSTQTKPTIAALMRALTVGRVVTLTAFAFKGNPSYNKWKGMPRTVRENNTVGFALSPANQPDASCWSYLDWPKAAELTRLDDQGFAIVRADGPTLTYTFG
jgi:hypothetical protein